MDSPRRVNADFPQFMARFPEGMHSFSADQYSAANFANKRELTFLLVLFVFIRVDSRQKFFAIHTSTPLTARYSWRGAQE
jgi:hypothetical protein